MRDIGDYLVRTAITTNSFHKVVQQTEDIHFISLVKL